MTFSEAASSMAKPMVLLGLFVLAFYFLLDPPGAYNPQTGDEQYPYAGILLFIFILGFASILAKYWSPKNPYRQQTMIKDSNR